MSSRRRSGLMYAVIGACWAVAGFLFSENDGLIIGGVVVVVAGLAYGYLGNNVGLDGAND